MWYSLSVLSVCPAVHSQMCAHTCGLWKLHSGSKRSVLGQLRVKSRTFFQHCTFPFEKYFNVLNSLCSCCWHFLKWQSFNLYERRTSLTDEICLERSTRLYHFKQVWFCLHWKHPCKLVLNSLASVLLKKNSTKLFTKICSNDFLSQREKALYNSIVVWSLRCYITHKANITRWKYELFLKLNFRWEIFKTYERFTRMKDEVLSFHLTSCAWRLIHMNKKV